MALTEDVARHGGQIAELQREIARKDVLIRQLQGQVAFLPPVSALPSNPADGEECFFQSAGMANQGDVWHLRYRATSPSAYKWEYVGGAPIHDNITTTENYASAATGDLATPGPSVTLPLAGDFDFAWGARIQMLVIVAGAEGWMHMSVAGGFPLASAAVASMVPTAQFGGGASTTEGRVTGLAAGALCRAKYQTQGGIQFSFGQRWMRVRPVRVG